MLQSLHVSLSIYCDFLRKVLSFSCSKNPSLPLAGIRLEKVGLKVRLGEIIIPEECKLITSCDLRRFFMFAHSLAFKTVVREAKGTLQS